MAEKENSAIRLHRFIQRMVPQPENAQTVQVLMHVLGVSKNSSARQQNAELSRGTALLFSELDSLVAELKRYEYSEEVINSITGPFDRLSAGNLVNQWQQNKPVFAASLPVLRSFGETPNLLTNDGAVISSEELAELKEAIENLRKEVKDSGLPERVKKFVSEQLDFIARAIRDYPLAGIKSFKTAATEAIFHEAENLDIVTEYNDKPQIQGLKAIQEKVVKVSRFSIEFSKFLNAMDTIHHYAGPAFQSAGTAVHHLSGWVQRLK